MTKQRIWELDCARGLALIGMIGIHFLYDLVDLFGILPWNLPLWYLNFKNNYGAVFLLISGISVTLGSHCVRRGAVVFCSGFLCTAVTLGMYLSGMTDRSIIIYFGVLQCLGTCMVLWALFDRLPSWVLTVLGVAFTAIGWYLRGQSPDVPWILIPFGFAPWWFASSDYFPLLPNFGYFLLGAVLGKMLYRTKTTRFPKVNAAAFPLAQLGWMGKHSLLIYLLHQPILAAIAMVVQIL